MKKFTSLTICCTLLLAGAALAQTPEEQASPGAAAAAPAQKGKAETKPGRKKGNDRATPKDPQSMSKAQPAAAEVKPVTDVPKGKSGKAARVEKASEEPKSAPASATDAATAEADATPVGTATPAATATVTPMGTATPGATASPAPSASATVSANANATPAASVAAGTAAQVKTTAKQPEPKVVEKIKEQHANFRAQPRPKEVPAVTFSANRQIQGAERWQGPQYEVYRSYRPERHDQSYYRSKYDRVELVGGGYYYFNNGYWYPAWGYDNSAEYYAYDAPIYVGKRAVPPDRIIADVQAALQALGYYRGEVDGLLGPLTREALVGYQSRHGLAATAVIDEPTLNALGMG